MTIRAIDAGYANEVQWDEYENAIIDAQYILLGYKLLGPFIPIHTSVNEALFIKYSMKYSVMCMISVHWYQNLSLFCIVT